MLSRISLFSILFSLSLSSPDFDYSLARKTLDFAASVYAENPWPCLRKNNATLLFRSTSQCDYFRDECWSMISFDSDTIYVAFRGTRSKIQLISELLETMGEPKKKLHAGGSVQHYFYTALQNIWPPMEKILRKLVKTFPTHRILFTGHSLGGALASIASTVFAHRHPTSTVNLITFGEPRVGNLEYSETHNRLVNTSWRIVHRYDLVAHIPYCYENLRSHSCSPLFNHGPWHHGTEIWFPGDMNLNATYKICEGLPLNEDDKCSNSAYLHYGIRDHLYYFGIYVSQYGDAHCQP